VENAVATERARRLELELELQRLQQDNSSVFSSQENGLLQHIHGKLDRNLEFSGTMFETTINEQGGKSYPGKIVRKYRVIIPLPNLLFSFAKEKDLYDRSLLDRHLYISGEMKVKTAELRENALQYFSFNTPDLTTELFAYELLERQVELNSRSNDRYVYFFSPKMYRLIFWADYNHIISEGFSIYILPLENEGKD
jgi:hypothetical protein